MSQLREGLTTNAFGLGEFEEKIIGRVARQAK
jgi:hypothetical protein